MKHKIVKNPRDLAKSELFNPHGITNEQEKSIIKKQLSELETGRRRILGRGFLLDYLRR